MNIAFALLCLVATLLPKPRASEAPYLEADRLYFHRNEPGSLARSRSLLEALPEEAGSLWRLGRLWIRLGERAAGRERAACFEKAKGLLDRARKADPSCAQAWYWWGVAAGRWGQEKGMMKSVFLVGPIRRSMRRALELDRGHGGAHLVLGEMLRRLPGVAGGSRKAALEELEAAVRLWPDYLPAWISLAEAQAEAGLKEAARGSLERALEVASPADPGEFDENRAEAGRMMKRLGN
jgi:tetratricopeptide (TPR) repeat protein